MRSTDERVEPRNPRHILLKEKQWLSKLYGGSNLQHTEFL
jgi:hypothetical protein